MPGRSATRVLVRVGRSSGVRPLAPVNPLVTAPGYQPVTSRARLAVVGFRVGEIVNNIDGTGATSNGRGSDLWFESWLHFSVERPSAGYCRITFDHPPVNSITATTVAELAELVGLIDQDQDLTVVVFANASPNSIWPTTTWSMIHAARQDCRVARPGWAHGLTSRCVSPARRS